MPIGVDLTELPAAVRKRMHEILTDENAREMVQARIRQEKIARFYHDNRPRAMDGIGEKVMAVDTYWVSYFRMQYGADIWEDPDFEKWLRREDEATRVRSGGTKVMSGWGGLSGGATRKRFRKTY